MNIIKTSLALTLFILFPFHALAGELTGEQIAQVWDKRDDGNTSIAKTKFILENKRGQQRIRETIRYWKDYEGQDGIDEKSVLFFLSPPDIRKTGFLNWSYAEVDKDDDQWLYLPALKKVKRIASDNKEDYFMGTDLTYDDMGDRKIEEDTFKLLKEETHKGKECYVLEAIPKKKDYMYSKRIIWLDKKELTEYTVLFYDRKGKELKKLEEDWIKVSGIWTLKKMYVENFSNGHKTTINIEDVQINPEVNDSVFVKKTLKNASRFMQ
ncbi:MAG: outer membrane lipoprotein-sorting protein [Nitrospinae bacterium]|nr:outer membrane lipoprotein-sorting protein [Nitrospinota bacterium]